MMVGAQSARAAARMAANGPAAAGAARGYIARR